MKQLIKSFLYFKMSMFHHKSIASLIDNFHFRYILILFAKNWNRRDLILHSEKLQTETFFPIRIKTMYFKNII